MSTRLNKYAGAWAELNADAQATNPSGEGVGLGYAKDLNENTVRNIFGRQDFIQDLMDYYQQRDGKTFSSIDEARDYFMEDRRWRNMNSISISRDLMDVNSQSDEQSMRLARLQRTFDILPNFYEDGGDGWRGFFTNAVATIADPVNLVGFGSGGAAAKVAAASVMKEASQQAMTKTALEAAKNKAFKAGIRAGIYKGARNEAIASGVVEGGLDAGIQKRNTELGLQDGYSATQGAMSVAGGAAIGGALGSVLGPLGAVTPNPFKGGRSGISQGMIEGRQSARADATTVRNDAADDAADEAQLAAGRAATVDPFDEQHEALKVRIDQARQSETTDTGTGQTVDVPEVGSLAETASDRLERANNRMKDLGVSAARKDVDADAAADKGDFSSADKLRKQAIELRRAQKDLSDKFARVLSDEYETNDALVGEILDSAKRAETLQLSFDPDAQTIDPNAKINADGSPTQGSVTPGRNPVDDEEKAQTFDRFRAFPGEDEVQPQNITGGDGSLQDAPDVDTNLDGTQLSEADEAARATLQQQRQNRDDLKVEQQEALKQLKDAETKIETVEEVDEAAETSTLKDLTAALEQRQLSDYDENAPASALSKSIAARNNIDAVEGETNGELNARIQDAVSEKIAGINAREDANRINSEALKAAQLRVETVGRAIATNDAGLEVSDGVFTGLAREERQIIQDAQDALEAEEIAAAQAEVAKKTKPENGDVKYEELGDGDNPHQERIDFLVTALGHDRAKVETDLSFDKRTKAGKAATKAKFVELFEQGYVRNGLSYLRQSYIRQEGETRTLNDGWFNVELNQTKINDLFERPELRDLARQKYLEVIKASGMAQKAHENALMPDPSTSALPTPDEVRDSLTKQYGEGFAEIALATEPFKSSKLPDHNMDYNKVSTPAERKLFIESLSEEFKLKFNKMQEQILNAVLAKEGVTTVEARRVAEEVYLDRLHRAMLNQDNTVSRSNEAITEQITKTELYVEQLEKAKQTYFEAMSNLPMNAKLKKKAILEQTKRLIVLEENPAMARPGRGSRMVVPEVGELSLEQAIDAVKVQEFLDARNQMRSLKSRYVGEKNLSVGEIIEREHTNIKRLYSKKDTTMRINKAKSGFRLGTDVSVNLADDAEDLAPHIGMIHERTGTGSWDVKKKLQSSIAPPRYQRLIKQAVLERTSGGPRQKATGQATAKAEIKKARIDSVSENAMVKNPEEMKRNELVLNPILAAIEEIKSAKSKISAAKRKLDKGPTAKMSEEALEDKVVEAEAELEFLRQKHYSLAGKVFIEKSGAQTVESGLQRKATSLSQTGQKQAVGETYIKAEVEGPKNTLRYARLKAKQELNDPNTAEKLKARNGVEIPWTAPSERRAKLLQHMLRTINNIALGAKNGKPFPPQSYADKVANIVYAGEAKDARAARIQEKVYQQQVLDGMYNYAGDTTPGLDDYDSAPVFDAEGNPFAREDIDVEDLGEVETDNTSALNNESASPQEIQEAAIEIVNTEARGQEAPTAADWAEENGVLFGDDDAMKVEDAISDINEQKTATRTLDEEIKRITRENAGKVDEQEMARLYFKAITDSQENQKVITQAKQAKATPPVKTAKQGPIAGSSTHPDKRRPAGKPYAPAMATLRSGIEVDGANDFQYYKTDGEHIAIYFDGNAVGRINKEADGKLSIIRQSQQGEAKPYRISGPFSSQQALMKAVPRVFEDYVAVTQARDSRFTVNKNAKGSPHFNEVFEKTETYKDQDTVAVNDGDIVDPLDSPQMMSDPDNQLTWTQADFELGEGYTLAVQIVDPKAGERYGAVKAASRSKQVTIETILGQDLRDGFQYIVGTVKKGSDNGFAARETFRPLEPETTFVNQRGAEMTGLEIAEIEASLTGVFSPSVMQSGRRRKVAPSNIDAIKDKPLKSSNPEALQFLNSKGYQTIGNVIDGIEQLEQINFQQNMKSQADYEFYFTLRELLSQVHAENVPNGVQKPNTRMVQATEQIRSIMTGMDDVEAQTVIDFLERLSIGTNGVVPKFKAGDRSAYSQNAPAKAVQDRNRITLNTEAGRDPFLPEGRRQTPLTMEAVHEVGHWVYSNVLTESEKTIFWRSIGKMYTDGQLDMREFHKRTLDANLISNSMDNPAELFANQFLKYALNEDIVRAPGSRLDKLFEKVARNGLALLKWMRGDTDGLHMKMDEELHEIFSRVLPKARIDPETQAPYKTISKFAHLAGPARKHGIPSVHQTKSMHVDEKEMLPAEFAAKQLVTLDDRIEKLQGAKMFAPRETGDSYGLAVELEQIGREVYGEYGGKQGETHHRPSDRAKDGGGSARIMALDGTSAIEPIMKAQYRIHAFLQQLRVGDTYIPSGENMSVQMTSGRTSGLNEGQQEIDVIISEELAGYKPEAQEVLERLMANDKAGYQSLDAGVVDHLHALSTDLQNAMQVGIKEYTMMYQRKMPSTRKGEFIGLDAYTGHAYVAKHSMISQYHINKNKKLRDDAVATGVAVQEVADYIRENNIKVGEADKVRLNKKIQTIKAEVKSEQVLKDEIAKADKTNLAEVQQVAGSLQALQRRERSAQSETALDTAEKNLEQEGKLDAIQSIIERNNPEEVSQLRAWAEENGDVDTLNLLGKSTTPVDAPEALSPNTKSPAVAELTDGVTHRKAPVQEAGQSLFNKLANKLGRSEEDDFLTEYDIAIITGSGVDRDMASGRLMDFEQAGADDVELETMGDETPITAKHADYGRARKTIRGIASAIDELNNLRQAAHDAADRARKTDRFDKKAPENAALYKAEMQSIEEYDAKSAALRAEIFPQLYDIAYRMLPAAQRTELRLAAETRGKKVSEMIADKEQQIYKGVTLGNDVKGKGAAAALNQIMIDTSNILDGILRQPQSLNEQRMEYKRLSYSGLASGPEDFPHLNASVDRNGQTRIHPSVAGKWAVEYRKVAQQDHMQAVARHIGIHRPEELNHRHQSIRFNVARDQNATGNSPSYGEFGEGVYHTGLMGIDKFYDAGTLAARISRQLDSAFVTPIQRQAADMATQNIIHLREKIKDMTVLKKSKQHKYHNSTIHHLLEAERKHWEILSDISKGAVSDNKVTPVAVRMRKPFDATPHSFYSINEGEGIDLEYFMLKFQWDTDLPDKIYNDLLDKVYKGVSGDQLYKIMTDDIFFKSTVNTKSLDQAKAKFNRYLKSEGYDGINYDGGSMSFSTGSVKSLIGDNGFDAVELALSQKEKPGGNLKLTASIVEEMMVVDGKLPNHQFLAVALESQRMGMPKPVMDVVGKMIKGRDLTQDDTITLSKWSTVKNFFRENSSMFRENGAHWFADLVKPLNGTGTYERHDALLARRLQPIIAKLNALPDAGNNLQRWGKRNRGLALGALDTGQPASHKRIIKALRRGRGAVERLKPEEKSIALEIGAAFSDELARMKALGITVGDTRKLGSDFYVPQVWDKESILENPIQFRRAMTGLLMREQMADNFEGPRKTTEELEEVARKVSLKITRGHDPSIDGEVQATLSDPFAARVLKLQPGDYEEMDGFLVQDLQGIMAKYFDRTTRKRVLTERFGINGHGFDAYLAVAQKGPEAAVNLLMSNNAPKLAVTTESGMAQVDKLEVAALKMTQDEVKNVVDQVKAVLSGDTASRVNGKQEAMSILTTAAGVDGMNDQFRMRADAIVNAFVDFPDKGPSASAVIKMRQMMDVLNKKPIDGGTGNEARYKISRALKSFTSVSLLGFTALTSLPDIGLPLVRSGNMRAFAKAWSKYMTDPDYRQSARNVGVGIDNLMHERMVHMAGDGNQRFANSFFNATLLTPWTNTMREVASLVGFESFKTEINRAVRMQRQGKTDTKSYQTAVRYLERYGLTGPNARHDFLSNGSFRIDALPSDEAIEMQVQEAMIRFTNESIYTPNPNDIPLWGQGPWGSLMFQLKSFPFMMQRMGKYMVDEARQGNYYPIMYMATAGVGVGAASISIKDHVQQRGGEDERTFANRDRSMTASKPALAEMLGVDENSLTDEALGWWIDGLMAVGGLGFLAEMLYNSATQLEDGSKWSYVRMMGGVFGPQVGTTELAYNTAAMGQEQVKNLITGENENSKTRVGMNSLGGRIPVLGGVASIRKALTDTVAGEPKKPGPKKKSSSGFNSSGFGSGFGGKFD